MPYISMTEELIRIIKDERKKNKLSGEKLAEAIDKSRAFISQIENGKVPFIEIDILQKILKAVTKLSDDDFNKYIEELLKKIAVPLSLDVIQKEEWMYVFDLQIREFEIPEKVILYITTKCKELNITLEDLVKEINMNKELEFANTYEPNKINVILKKDAVGWAIRFDLDKYYIKKIIKREIRKINYVNALGIIYNILLLEGISRGDAKLEAEKFLTSNDIITILERDKKRDENIKNKIESGEDFEPEDVEVTENDREFRKALKKTNFYFELLNDQSPSDTYKYLNQLNKNLDTDRRLMIAIMSLPFDGFKPLPPAQRKEFYNELKELVKKFLKLSKEYSGDVEYK